MPATKRLVVDLPAGQVDRLEAKVAAGEFSSADEAVAAALNVEGQDDWLASQPGMAWLAEGDAADEEMEDGRDPGRPAAEVFAELKTELLAMSEDGAERR